MSANSTPSHTPPQRPQFTSAPSTPPQRPQSTSASPTLSTPSTNPNPTPPAIAPNLPSSHSHHTLGVNHGERTHRPMPTASTQWPNNRYNPPVPSRMSGVYSSNNSVYNGNLSPSGRRFGTHSASSSPPGTPPNGLRDYYLNIAYQRSQNRLYPPGSPASSNLNLLRPGLSTVQPQHDSPLRRSYSADHLAVDEPEITITGPDGSSSTEEHATVLQKVLSDLVQSEGRASIDADDHDEEGPAMMKGSNSSSATKTGSAANIEGVLLTPKVLANRLVSERTDITPVNEPAEKEKKQTKEKHKSHNRISKLFNREASATNTAPEQVHITSQPARAPIQPSKTGVLSNLLKLQSGTRHKTHTTHSKHHKEKEKKRRSALYSRSANTSVISLSSKPLFGPYPIPPTSTTAVANHRNGNGYFDPHITAFAQGHSPIHSPGDSPRESISQDYFMSGASTLHSLSHEEKMRITFAVADILKRQDYVLRLARAMIKYGAPSHRLEEAIDHTARTLELNMQCVYMPNVMVVAFTDYETHTSETHLLKVSAGLNMHKFAQVHQVLKMVTHSSMPVEEAIMKLDAINTEKDIWPRWANIVSFAIASFCTAPMFYKGDWIDAVVAGALGISVGLMSWLSEKLPSYAHICEVTMSVFVSFIAESLHSHICRSAVKMGGTVMLLPGYTITTAILELSSRHMISGSVRLFYAIIYSLLLGYGLTIGASLWNLVDSGSTPAGVTGDCPTTLSPAWNILFVPLFAFSLNIYLKLHPRQWVLATILAVIGYVVSYALSTWTGAKTEVSSALASFSIGFVGNVYQRMTHQLTFPGVICAVFFLVPGSLGLKGAMAWFTDDMTGGVNFALQMVITAIAISVGLFGSALVVYPMGKSRSAQMTF
ncbi:hypothetical protein BGX21_001311 [Mortierella sp. AD011]|nr:hypothetical protein BGX20_007480 [Mortierella sp. AD010]KAF9384403.1 hypothetical protein BGX21_001311 [Mortierella sp. AD011]